MGPVQTAMRSLQALAQVAQAEGGDDALAGLIAQWVDLAAQLEAARAAHSAGVGVNAGHDLNLENLAFFASRMPYLDEVSIGHALICDALYLGLEETVRRYKECLKQ